MIKAISNNVSLKIIALAVLIRILVIPFFFHPDIKTYNFQSSFLRQGVIDIYSYLIKHKENLTLREEFIYFPLTYFFVGGYQIIVSPLLGSGFLAWLSDASQDFVKNPEIFRYLFLLKLPYLILDISMAFALGGLVSSKETRKKVMLLWLFNPFTITLIYFYSNIDIIPVLLITLSLLLLKKNKFFAGVLLGLAAGFKAYPLIFLPILLLDSKNVKEFFLTVFGTLGAFGLVIVPFLNSSFRESALVSGLTTRLLIPSISLGFNESIIIPVFLISLFLVYIIMSERKLEVWKYCLILLLIIFSFVHYHIQWLLWIAPFIILVSSNSKKIFWISLILSVVAFCIPLLYDDRSMTFSLLRSYSNYYTLVPIPFSIVQKVYDPGVVQSILHSVLAGISAITAIRLFTKEQEER